MEWYPLFTSLLDLLLPIACTKEKFRRRSLDGGLATPADANALAPLLAATVRRLVYDPGHLPPTNPNKVRPTSLHRVTRW